MKNTTNVFLNGMTSDMHPLTTSQQEYTDALNATLITFNGNEQMMLNDMGNTKIQDSKTGNIMGLRKGYVPVGMTEHGGVIYIASVNKEGKGEIGTIPSPIITYKDLKLNESNILDFTSEDSWVKTNNESPVYLISKDDSLLNPEDGFLVLILGNNTSKISTLKEKHLYIPHLIAITSKAEKDITPTKCLTEEDSWFSTTSSTPDLETLNQINDKETVNFLTYPKIESGRLGIKFTKENIKSFNIAPNKGGRFYPVLQYKEDETGKKTYYSSIYGVQYETESDVIVDKIIVTTVINGNKESTTYTLSSNQTIFLPQIGVNHAKIKINPIFKYDNYLCRYENNLPEKWPESDSEYLNDNKSLYTIDLGDDFNLWIDLTIEYYYSAWDKPLGTYHMTYNPYYMDSLNLFITGYFWSEHVFANGKSSFVQYRKYTPGEEPLETYIQTLVNGNSTPTEITVDPENSEIKLYEKENLGFYDDDPGFRPLNIPFSEQQSWKFILPEKQTNPIEILDTVSTYLELKPYIKNSLGTTEILTANIEIPISIYSTDLKDWLDNRAARNSDGLKGDLQIEYQYSIKKEGDSTNIAYGYGTSEIKDIKVVNNHPISIIEVIVSHNNEDVTLTEGSSLIDDNNNRKYGNYAIKSIKYIEGIEYTYKKDDLGNVIDKDEEIKNIFFYNNLSKYETEEGAFIDGLKNHVKNEILNKQGLNEFPKEWHPLLQFSFHNWQKNNYIDFNTSININIEGLEGKEYSTDPYILNFKIKKILTNKLLHYLQYSKLNTKADILSPVLTVGYNKEAKADVYVSYKSECYVYPLFDLFVNILNEDNSISEVPAQLIDGKYTPIIIDYKKNYITLSGKKMSTETGYTRKNTSDEDKIQASFNLDGLEEYREKATIEKLAPGKVYLLRNGDNKVKITIKSNREITLDPGLYCILRPTENSIYTLTSELNKIPNVGFRSLGLYEFIKPIHVASSITDDIISGFTVSEVDYNKEDLIDHSLQSVYCYTETDYTDDIIIKVKNQEDTHNIVKFLCTPVPEFGYQKRVNTKPLEIKELDLRDTPSIEDNLDVGPNIM